MQPTINSNTNINRLEEGGRINRHQVIRFKYNGKVYQGYAGDTVASALLANGVKIFARSFKYGRPRGVFTASVEEPNAILQVGGTEAYQIPNVKATEQLIYEGLTCQSTNGWPNVKMDIMRVFGWLFGPIMTAGFYYKTFIFPRMFWKPYEALIRRGSGLGRAPTQPDPDHYDKITHHVDLLIIGAGVAGISAALVAANSDAKILLVDEQAEMGGHLLHNCAIKPIAPDNDCIENSHWLATSLHRLQGMQNVTLLSSTTVYAAFDDNFFTASQKCTDHLLGGEGVRQRMHRIYAKQSIIASGAVERPIVFNNNDRPGCMLADAVLSYIHRYAVVPGKRLVLMATNDNAYHTAIAWHQAGREVVAIVDTRPSIEGATLPTQAQELGIPILTHSAIIDTKGMGSVRAAVVASIESIEQGMVTVTDAVEKVLKCDTIATSGGWSPLLHLSCHNGSKPQWNDTLQAFVPNLTATSATANQHCVGAVSGEYRLKEIINQALTTATQACQAAGFTVEVGLDAIMAAAELDEPKQQQPAEHIFSVNHNRPNATKQFVDFQVDVTVDAILLATREGFESIEHVKRYTALGFGTDQGKTSNVNGLAIVAKQLNKEISAVGTTVFRPNYTPVAFGLVTGRKCRELFEPNRYTPIQPWHESQGAVYENVGQWKRPRYYPQEVRGRLETMNEAVERECLAVRNQVGIIDASTLGKIDIQGADAREFLNRIYTNAWSKLAVGSCRYGLMCGDDGLVKDDGVTVCLGENHFMMHTTTGGAAMVLEWLEMWHQTEWQDLQVYFNSVTDHWCTAAIAGPHARSLLKDLSDLSDADLDGENFKFMQWRNALVAGIPARIYRISFTGELSFEINVNANYGLALWQKIIEMGKNYSITPYGTEAMHVLRAEKGFPIIGQDTDGSIGANNLGMGRLINFDKPYSFIGKRGMRKPAFNHSNSKQLVGLKTINPSAVLAEGAQLVLNPKQALPMTMLGHVTSSYHSPILGHSIALAMIKGGQQLIGERIVAAHVDGSMIEAEICNSVFYDPEGRRQRG